MNKFRGKTVFSLTLIKIKAYRSFYEKREGICKVISLNKGYLCLGEKHGR